MDVSIIETSGLGDRSYLVTHHGIAVVVDPQRDIDRVLTLAEKARVRITHVLETHLHNDYVTGGLALSRSVGADYAVPAGDDVDYDRRAVADGDVIDAGPIQLEVLHTPGHTHHHVSYVLRDDTGTPSILNATELSSMDIWYSEPTPRISTLKSFGPPEELTLTPEVLRRALSRVSRRWVRSCSPLITLTLIGTSLGSSLPMRAVTVEAGSCSGSLLAAKAEWVSVSAIAIVILLRL